MHAAAQTGHQAGAGAPGGAHRLGIDGEHDHLLRRGVKRRRQRIADLAGQHRHRRQAQRLQGRQDAPQARPRALADDQNGAWLKRIGSRVGRELGHGGESRGNAAAKRLSRRRQTNSPRRQAHRPARHRGDSAGDGRLPPHRGQVRQAVEHGHRAGRRKIAARGRTRKSPPPWQRRPPAPPPCRCASPRPAGSGRPPHPARSVPPATGKGSGLRRAVLSPPMMLAKHPPSPSAASSGCTNRCGLLVTQPSRMPAPASAARVVATPG